MLHRFRLVKKVEFFGDFFTTLNPLELIYFFILVLGFTLLFISNILTLMGEEQFVYLSYSFLQGNLFFSGALPPHASDTTFYNGHYFWPSGPLPAVVLIPFVYFLGLSMQQGFLAFFLHLINFFLLFRIAQKITNSTLASFWLSFGYIFSTVYLYIALLPWSWFLSQTFVTTFLLLAINEFLGKKRFFFIGFFIAGAVLSRANLALALIFFLLNLIFEKEIIKIKIKKLAILLFPVLIGFILLFTYNYLRFGDIFERGDSFTKLINTETTNNRSYGAWNLIHFPANLYYLFLKSPDPVFFPETRILSFPFLKADTWGMAILFTSPILIWIIKAPWKNFLAKPAVLTVLLILFFDLGWFSLGYQQFGYRYALDFQPFLFILLCLALKNGIPKLFKIVAISSFFINYFFIITLFT